MVSNLTFPSAIVRTRILWWVIFSKRLAGSVIEIRVDYLKNGLKLPILA